MSTSQAAKTVPVPLYVAWLTSLLASGASFYFIEILNKPAATLCWFERMLMFGLFLILSVALLSRDLKVRRYALPFLALGIPAALYQQLIFWDVIKITPSSCSATAIACSTKYFELFGFITQATLCLTAFTVIALALWRLRKA